ncbi:MAG: hypothetical protein M1839_002196 [Geoglossum umbratile]|nr:MAG: hypothetical protein M1839_002196 [Geoglossum umbratile]
MAVTAGDTTAQARAICVKWKTDDLTLFPTSVATTLETSTTETSTSSSTGRIVATVSPTSPTKPTPTAASTAASAGGLPRSTKIVIGVLIPTVLICILAAIFFYFHRRRWADQVDPNPGQQLHPDDGQQPTGDKGYGFADLQPPDAYRAQSPGNALSLPVLPAGADLSMRQGPWEPSVEMPVPEDLRANENFYSGYSRKA